MAVLRVIEFQAKPGREEALHSALLAVIPLIANAAGCRKVRLLCGLDDPARYIMIEDWDSIEAHKKAATEIPAGAFAKITPLLKGAPKAAYYQG